MKTKKILAIVVAALMITAMLAACDGNGGTSPSPSGNPPASASPPATDTAAGVDFAKNQNFDFAVLDPNQKDSGNEFKLEIADFDGKKALKVSGVSKNKPVIGISLDELVGADIAKIASIKFKIAVKNADGKFYPVSGVVQQFAGDNAELVLADNLNTSKWAINSADVNPKECVAKIDGSKFVAGKNNYITIKRTAEGDNDLKPTETSDIYLISLDFLGSDNKPLTLKADAKAAFPEGYGEFVEVKTFEVDLLPDNYETVYGNWIHAHTTSTEEGKGFNVGEKDGKGVDFALFAGAVQLVIEYTGGAVGSEAKFYTQYSSDWQWNEFPVDSTDCVKSDGKVALFLPDPSAITDAKAVFGFLASNADDNSPMVITRMYLVTTVDPATVA